MRLQICHLSDIHFNKDNNAIEKKKDKFCSAILKNAFKGENVLFLISGDIAQSGYVEEYNIAHAFFSNIKEELYKQKNIVSYFIFAPGNHDAILDEDDYDDETRRKEVLSQKDNMDMKRIKHFECKLCEKQNNYFDFKNKFINEANIKRIETDSLLLDCFELYISGYHIYINVFNTAWISQRHEKPGEIYIPQKIYGGKIIKKDGLNITMFHHPSNWMHPNDKLFFDNQVVGNSDILFVGHEHVGRDEHIQTRESQYDIQYGEILQDPVRENNSSFIINYIENEVFKTIVYKWDDKKFLYSERELPQRKLGYNANKSISFLPEYRKKLNSMEMQVTHPNKCRVELSDLFIFPNVEEYNKNNNLDESTKDKVTIRGEELINYILDNKCVEFSGGAKVGKSALAKMIALTLEYQDVHAIVMDCKKNIRVSSLNVDSVHNDCVNHTYGKDKADAFMQLSLDKKIIIIDNFDFIKSVKEKSAIISYFSNFYMYIVIFSNVSYDLAILGENVRKTGIEIKHCEIKELGHRQRNALYKKWYMLNEGENIFLDNEIEQKVKKATETINALKGNGYLPSIAANIIIILQQLEYQSEKLQDRSNYGYMYEFLITKSILDMKKNNKNISDDIAMSIMVNVAEFMLKAHKKVITLHEFTQIVEKYNKHFITNASYSIYLEEYINVDLAELENEQFQFKYPYIHYYFTAKYIAGHLYEKNIKRLIWEMAENLQIEEYADIMIFLCHLSKERYILNSVLQCSKKLLQNYQDFDFDKNKNLKFSFDEYLDTSFIPEENIEERRTELLERQDVFEEEKNIDNEASRVQNNEAEIEHIEEIDQKMEILDGVFKSIEVMGQILKNYPGTIDGSIKKALLREIHALGMRSLTFSREILSNEIVFFCNQIQDKVINKIREQANKQDDAIDENQIWHIIKEKISKMSNQMDNLFGIMSYILLRRLANSLGNEDLKTLINHAHENSILSYQLMKKSIYLNEFGILQGEEIISFYDDLVENRNIFATKLLKLFVYDHYFVFGSKDVRLRQRIWKKFGFDKKQEKQIMLNQIETTK